MELKLYKEQINEVQNLVDKMEQGNLSTSELTELELITRLLHERSIILKYKAFEGVSNAGTSRASVPNDLDVEALEATKSENESPFDWNPTSEESDDSPSLEKLEDIIEEEIEDVMEEEPVIELTEEEMKIETPPSIQDIMGEISEDKEIVQEIIEENIEMVADDATTTNSSNEDFVSQLKLSDSSTHSFSLGTKIDSLIGAFGLNEKLRFINDLFDGSSESFNDAVKLLDSQNDLNEAYSHVNTFASSQNWEPDDETVAEFVSFVNRRYA